MHPTMFLACVVISAVAVAAVSNLASAPHDVPMQVISMQAEPEPAGAVATPNHDPYRIYLEEPATVVEERPTAETVATPNHDPRHLHLTPSVALNTVTPPAAPESAKPAEAVAAFVHADTMLYARDNARLRAAPSNAADVLTKLAADTPLRATARTSDGAWWRVSLTGGRIGYVHRTAVTQYRMAKPKPLAAPAPVVAAALPQPASASRREGLLGYVDDTMDWLADAADRGSAPTAVRTEH